MSSLKPTLKRVLTGGWDEPAGQIAPQPLLADGSRLDDRVGYRFAALVEPELAETMPPRIRELLAARDVVIVADEAPEQRAWLRQTGAAAVLVRPDRYVLGAARSIQELDALAQAI